MAPIPISPGAFSSLLLGGMRPSRPSVQREQQGLSLYFPTGLGGLDLRGTSAGQQITVSLPPFVTFGGVDSCLFARTSADGCLLCLSNDFSSAEYSKPISHQCFVTIEANRQKKSGYAECEHLTLLVESSISFALKFLHVDLQIAIHVHF